MGCFCCKTSVKEPKKLVYSWVERKHLDPADYVMENLNGCTAYKSPGSIGGQQFVIRNCQDSNIYLLDHTGSVTIDDCQRCTIVVGPTKQSVFVRDTINSTVVVACGQFRVRDCASLKISLFCSTQPVIESSRELQFSCYQFYYNQLADQFVKADLNIWNNNWRTVYDYTWNEGDNWTVNEKPIVVELSDQLNKYGITSESKKSIVPLTKCNQQSGENCFVAFGCGIEASRFVQALQSHETDLLLIKCNYSDSKDTKVFQERAKLFGTKKVQRIIGLQLQGPHAINKCLAILANDFPQFTTIISTTDTEAKELIKMFFHTFESEFQP
ncbi:LOW QUALITY PROTEIN: protein XRP2-like [Rhopalosiphum maidis]|uniref:LOW QUALITY PROTEIN: protein XRP2-like n=1 Tax=Rhopalosiphum maidis TaxID=43146 RepID=UPI000EFE0FBF|nr:LOW QUALITY PROTEIN: protein XRP2-like [Rhopalosiphum maidis]